MVNLKILLVYSTLYYGRPDRAPMAEAKEERMNHRARGWQRRLPLVDREEERLRFQWRRGREAVDGSTLHAVEE